MFSKIFSQRKEYDPFIRPEWFNQPGRINYEDIKDIPDETIVLIFEKFEAIEKENNQINRHNRLLAEEAKDLFLLEMKEIGINCFGTRGGINKPYSDTIREIEYAITGRSRPARPSPSFYFNDKEVRIYNGSLSERIVKFKKQCVHSIEQEQKHNLLFRAACDYITRNGIEVSNTADMAELIHIANAHAEKAYVEENYPDGTEMEAADCNCCNTWTVGERRCSCGNRRQYLEVDGNVLDGFYAYAQPH